MSQALRVRAYVSEIVALIVSLLLGGIIGWLVGGWVGERLVGSAGGDVGGAAAGGLASLLMCAAALRTAAARGFGATWKVVAVLLGGTVLGGAWGFIGGALGALIWRKTAGGTLGTVVVAVVVLAVVGVMIAISRRRLVRRRGKGLRSRARGDEDGRRG